ncbi:MAG: HD domain-containing protein [Romboutsia sp.]
MNIGKRFLKSLKSDRAYIEFERLDNEKVLEEIIPQIKDMKIVGECKYHVVNCFEHSIYALQEFEDIIKKDEFFQVHLEEAIRDYLNTEIEDEVIRLNILKLGIFLHDMGKPQCKSIDKTGRVHFHDHEKVGANDSIKISKELNLSKESSELLYKYIKYHMILLEFYKNNDMSQEKLYRVFDVLGDEIIGILLLGYADIVSTRRLLDPKEDMSIIKVYMEYMLTNYLYMYKKS